MSQATFDYQVRDRSGKVIRGRIEAESPSVVATKLKGMGYAPIAITKANSGLKTEIKIPGMGQRVKLKDLAISARQFATMINSGLSLLRALSILSDQTENKALGEVFSSVRLSIEQGSSLSQAFAQHPKVFPPIMINMTKAGETGGFLDQVLGQLADNFEAEVKLRSTIKSAMTYPLVVFAFALLSLVGMLLFIVPVFAGLFDSLGGTLPLPTQILVMLSELLKNSLPLIILAMIGLAVLWGKYKNHARVRNVLDPIKLKAPVFGSLFQKIALSRFTRNLGTMIHAGVPILQALDIVADTTGNVVIARAVKDVEVSVRRGESLAGPLVNHPVFPAMVVQMMAVGEDTGALDQMLHKISDFYDAEVQATTEALTSLIEPLMIAVVGAMVGAMIIALYMPIFKIFDLIK
ncbi:MAG: type II secretion system F family protein [Actinobacteria bacterium]|jgi:type IV pilus assembly protein PilC|nr:type II secretion system F family protein [Actinomycetota bacterium]MCB9428467.1 type II secretion system F family protein [Actinomycetota bacterium]HPE12331.1 type II secretion system F family protein [Actinomycetota bacterium]HPQ83952.1 type II secretion system F family protein [Actinomycetota bacterium]HRV66203.1 type II secretion system F family protein [Candidatus Nanopelagicales bacterium]